MTKDFLIKSTPEPLKKLPKEKVEEVSVYTQEKLDRYEENLLREGASYLIEDSVTFNFLKEEKELYSTSDLKEIF